MLFSPVFQCSDDLLVKRKPWFEVLFQNENNTEIWDSQNWKSLLKLALVLHWAIAVLSSVSVLKGKLIGRNILLKVLCYSLSRQRKMTFRLLDSAHIFSLLFIYLFFHWREVGILNLSESQTGFERAVAYLNPSLPSEVTASKHDSGSFQLLHCTAVSAPFQATADHCTLLSAWWKNPCAYVGVNMCQPIVPLSNSNSNIWGFAAHLFVSAELWRNIKNQWSIKCKTWVS